MNFVAIEDQQDVLPVQIAPVSADDIRELPENSSLDEYIRQQTQKAQQATAKPKPELTRKRPEKTEFYADPTEEQRHITVEEFLKIRSADSLNVQAFKKCFNEVLSRMNSSRPSAIRPHDLSLPSSADFFADCLLAAKRSLPLVFIECLRTK